MECICKYVGKLCVLEFWCFIYFQPILIDNLKIYVVIHLHICTASVHPEITLSCICIHLRAYGHFSHPSRGSHMHRCACVHIHINMHTHIIHTVITHILVGLLTRSLTHPLTHTPYKWIFLWKHNYYVIYFIYKCFIDYDTDEETDELLDKQYTRSEKVDIPELSRPPVNRSAQVSNTVISISLPSLLLSVCVYFFFLGGGCNYNDVEFVVNHGTL